MKYGCIGEHLKHSFSKEIHEAFADYSYKICEIPKSEIDSFMKKADFSAINVTIPYKETVIPYLYYIDDMAKEIGAVNTVVNRDGKLYGYNTDFFGMKSLIEKMGLSLENKKVAILGTGGTSKTASSVAKALKASQIIRVSRTEKDGCITYDSLYSVHNNIDIIINTTPSGMFPNWDNSPADIDKFKNLSGVVDVVYNPLTTKLVRDAKNRGIKAACGLYMLVAQAVRASEIFLDVKYSDNTIDNVFKKILSPKKNIILTGMPACGKSTVGAILSKKLGMQVFDSDAIIEEKEGKSISDIFSENGEEYFRNSESQVISDLGSKNGIIISTGGGAVLREKNIYAMKQNGDVYFINRPLSCLIPTDDRPLAKDVDAIKKRFEERYDIYTSTADVIIDADCDAQTVAEKIAKDFLKG